MIAVEAKSSSETSMRDLSSRLTILVSRGRWFNPIGGLCSSHLRLCGAEDRALSPVQRPEGVHFTSPQRASHPAVRSARERPPRSAESAFYPCDSIVLRQQNRRSRTVCFGDHVEFHP